MWCSVELVVKSAFPAARLTADVTHFRCNDTLSTLSVGSDSRRHSQYLFCTN